MARRRVITVRVDEKTYQELKQLVAEGKYKTMSEAVLEGIKLVIAINKMEPMVSTR